MNVASLPLWPLFSSFTSPEPCTTHPAYPLHHGTDSEEDEPNSEQQDPEPEQQGPEPEQHEPEPE